MDYDIALKQNHILVPKSCYYKPPKGRSRLASQDAFANKNMILQGQPSARGSCHCKVHRGFSVYSLNPACGEIVSMF